MLEYKCWLIKLKDLTLKLSRLASIQLLVLAMASAHAQSTVGTYLEKQSPTRLDFGLLKLESALQYEVSRGSLGVESVSVSVRYSSAPERIVIIVGRPHPDGETNDAAKKACDRTIRLVRALLFVNPETGAPSANGMSLLGSYFSSVGKYDDPPDMGKRLEGITDIGVISIGAQSASCKAPLVGGAISFVEQ